LGHFGYPPFGEFRDYALRIKLSLERPPDERRRPRDIALVLPLYILMPSSGYVHHVSPLLVAMLRF
jgi:hypothetical protein